jgi:PAS domain S-box-containing protein
VSDTTVEERHHASSERPAPDSIWIEALRAAASVARQASASESSVLEAVTDAFRRLNLQGSVSLLDSEGMLRVQSPSLAIPAAEALRRLSGMDLSGYTFDPENVSVYREALRSGQPAFSPDRTEIIAQMAPNSFLGLLPSISKLLGKQPVIAAPLLLGEERLGTVNVSASWLSEADLPMMAALADHIAIALGHVRTRTELQSLLHRERLRNQVAQAVSSALELPVVLERVIRLAAEVMSADAGAIALVNPETGSLFFPYLLELPSSLSERSLPRDSGVTWKVIDAASPLIIEDYAKTPEAVPAWVDTGITSGLGVPLIIGDEVIGAMILFTKGSQVRFDIEQIEIAQAIASIAAIAIRNARLYEAATSRAEESQALIQTAHSISASLDIDTVLQLITEQAKILLHADACRIHLLDSTHGVLRCVVAVGPASDAAMALELKPGEGLTGHIVKLGEPLIVNDASADPRGVHIPGTPEDDPECLALAPLRIRQRTIGVMTVRRLGLEHPFVPSDLDLLTAFAAQAAVAIENAHLFGQIASQAQQLESEVADRTRELSTSEAHFRALVETSLAGILQIDTQGRFVYVNQRFADMLELDPQDLIGRPVTSYGGFLPDLHQPVLERFYARLRGETPRQEIHEVMLITTSGRRIPAILAASLITNEDDMPQGVTGLVLDISEQKTLESALQAERDRLDALLTNIGDAVMVTDAEGFIEYVNPGWERLNGYTAAEALGRTPSLITSGQHSQEFYSAMWSTILRGDTWRGEVVNCRKDGTFYDAALTITPVQDEDDRVINFVAVQHDISALKELDRLKSQFVSDVSHELRTPLTNIRLYLDLLERTESDSDKVTRYLQTLSRESERLANLIDDLLSLSRLDAGAVSLEPRLVDLNLLLSALVLDRQNLASERGLALAMEADASIPQITGDERLLTQVFTNLLTNAMSYTSEGGRITLRTRQEIRAGKEWLVAEVEDSGLGIRSEEIEQIFRRFFRGSASHTMNAPGTGLGLAICQEIIDRHDGYITVDSEGVPGQGSRFTVWLPATPAD